MFTGLVEAVGRVRELSGSRLVVDCPFAAELAAGESVAVDGCCLTQLPGHADALVADLSPETLARTNLRERRPGDAVNLERALALGARLGGHLVQGHVDGVERLLAATPEGGGARHRYSLEPDAAAFVVPKGSLAVDGVSLTVAALGPGWFEVALVPHTLASTNLGARRAGEAVNVEHDLVGKYLLRALGIEGRVTLTPAARARLGLDTGT